MTDRLLLIVLPSNFRSSCILKVRLRMGILFKKFRSRIHRKSKNDLTVETQASGLASSSEQFIETLRFKDPQGHGFAAESANNYLDRMMGRDASIVGSNNAKNGADRLVDGRWLQTKTYSSASASVAACFENGFKYYSSDGRPMGIEVPSDQYSEAVKEMEGRISNGEVRGVTDPKAASELIVKGWFSYETIRKIATPGTVESLSYDAATGAVISSGIFTISFMIVFAREMWGGATVKDALRASYPAGLKPAGNALLVHIASQQIARTPLSTVVGTSLTDLVKILPNEVVSTIANIGRTSPIYGAAASSHVTKVLSAGAVTIVIANALHLGTDINKWKNKDITTSRVAKNTVKNFTSAGTALVAARVGLIFGPIGGILGGVTGGVLGSAFMKRLLNIAFPDKIETVSDKYSELYALANSEKRELLDGLTKGTRQTAPDGDLENLLIKTADEIIVRLMDRRFPIPCPSVELPGKR